MRAARLKSVELVSEILLLCQNRFIIFSFRVKQYVCAVHKYVLMTKTACVSFLTSSRPPNIATLICEYGWKNVDANNVYNFVCFRWQWLDEIPKTKSIFCYQALWYIPSKNSNVIFDEINSLCTLYYTILFVFVILKLYCILIVFSF